MVGRDQHGKLDTLGAVEAILCAEPRRPSSAFFPQRASSPNASRRLRNAPAMSSRSTRLRGRVLRRRNISMNAGGKKACFGNGGRQPRVVAHDRPRRQLAGGDAPRPQSRQNSRCGSGTLRIGLEGRAAPADEAKILRSEFLDIEGSKFRKTDLGKMSRTNSWGPPGVQKKAATG